MSCYIISVMFSVHLSPPINMKNEKLRMYLNLSDVSQAQSSTKPKKLIHNPQQSIHFQGVFFGHIILMIFIAH